MAEGEPRAVEGAALKGAQDLQAGGKRLLQHSRPGRWDEFAKLMIEGGEKGEAAARAKDMDAAFLVGGDQVYNACNGCHKTYIPSPTRAPRCSASGIQLHPLPFDRVAVDRRPHQAVNRAVATDQVGEPLPVTGLQVVQHDDERGPERADVLGEPERPL